MKKKVSGFGILCFMAAMIAFPACDADRSSDRVDSIAEATGMAALADAIDDRQADALRSITVEDLAAESELPVIVINTEGGAPITNREDYVHATFEMTNAGADNITLKNMTDDGIRLRGNSTFLLPKKPYRIKFDKKISFFGRTANKSWVLLADYLDLSHIKNYTAYTLAAKLDGMDFAPLARHVNLFINGEFQGLYLFTDQVDEKEGRTNVEAEDELPEEEVPFLVELDNNAPGEGDEGVDYFTITNGGVDRHYAVKYPEAEDRDSEEQFEYIENYVTSVDSAVRAHGDYGDEVDLDSFVDFYLVQELMGQIDVNWKSVYMSRAEGGILKIGPVWDFDWSAGGPITFFEEAGNECGYTFWYSNGNWFAALLDDPDFVDDLYNRWTALSVTIDDHIDEIAAYRNSIGEDAKRDHALWKRYRRTRNPLLTFDGQYQYVLDYLGNRKQWMTDTIAALYDAYY
jgi:hypothetical protein